MKYQEKVKLAKTYLNKLKEGQSEEQIIEKLRSDGLPDYNITKIKSAANSLLHEEYREKVKHYLLEDELENHIDEFDLVDQETFETIQHKAVDSIRSKSNAEVSKLHRQGKSVEEIAEIVNNNFYSIHDVATQIEKHQYHQEPNKDKSLWVMGGIGAIVLGIFLTVTSSSSSDGSSKIYFGLVIAGMLMLAKSTYTQAELDREKKNNRMW